MLFLYLKVHVGRTNCHVILLLQPVKRALTRDLTVYCVHKWLSHMFFDCSEVKDSNLDRYQTWLAETNFLENDFTLSHSYYLLEALKSILNILYRKSYWALCKNSFAIFFTGS